MIHEEQQYFDSKNFHKWQNGLTQVCAEWVDTFMQMDKVIFHGMWTTN